MNEGRSDNRNRQNRRNGPKRRNSGKPKHRLSPGWSSRLAAAQIVLKIMQEGLDMDEALADSEAFDALEGADRGFARAIASSTLRTIGRIDGALAGFLDRPISKIDPPVLALLRIGAGQLWVMDAPAYAVVSATVDAARQWKPASRGGGLVNAILRRADRERDAFTALPTSRIWPDWLADRLSAVLGPEGVESLAQLQSEDPNTDITVKSNAADWAEKMSAELLANESIRLPTGTSITDLEGYVEGEWWVQDAGAALPARLLDKASGGLKGKRVADLCAAPGGKTMQLCAIGADVTALDTSPGRLAIVEENLGRTQMTAKLISADAIEWRPETPFDAILLDAPCSALGTLRRHPEGAWRRTAKGLSRYPAIQTKLLEAAADMVNPGGVVVYCVCTPLPEEGVDVITAALETDDWSALPINADEVPGFEHALTPEGWLLTAPPADRQSPHIVSDLFFIARLKRN